jgi:hypothetical protein
MTGRVIPVIGLSRLPRRFRSGELGRGWFRRYHRQFRVRDLRHRVLRRYGVGTRSDRDRRDYSCGDQLPHTNITLGGLTESKRDGLY